MFQDAIVIHYFIISLSQSLLMQKILFLIQEVVHLLGTLIWYYYISQIVIHNFLIVSLIKNVYYLLW